MPQDNDGKDDKNLKLEKYKCLIEQLRSNEGLLWRICGVFLLPHTIFLAFLLAVSFGKERIDPVGIIFAGGVGVVLTIFWGLAGSRSIAFADFRVAQAKRAEFPEWNLLKGEELEKFKKGDKVKIGGKDYFLKWHQKMKTRHAVLALIIIFLAAYSIIMYRGVCLLWLKLFNL